MFKDKKILLVSMGLFFLIIIALVFSFVLMTKNNKKVENKVGNNDLLKNNQEAIYKANSSNLQKLRPIDPSDHVWGENNAPVKIIVYSDFECPFCAGFADTMDIIKKEFSGKVEIAFRHFPLLTHSQAVPAAIASECASEQGKFWEMHDRLFADNKAENMSPEQFKKDAQDLGLDMAKFNQCLDTEKYKAKIQNSMLEGRNIGVLGTPTVFVNGEILPGAYPYEDFIGSDGKTEMGMKSVIEKYLK